MHKSCWKNISDVGFQHRFECFISVVSYKSKYVDLKWRKKGLETVNILGINYTTNKLILFSEKLSKNVRKHQGESQVNLDCSPKIKDNLHFYSPQHLLIPYLFHCLDQPCASMKICNEQECSKDHVFWLTGQTLVWTERWPNISVDR